MGEMSPKSSFYRRLRNMARSLVVFPQHPEPTVESGNESLDRS